MMFIGISLLVVGITTSVTKSCRLSEFSCKNGRCILTSQFCDGINDCEDDSDEPKFCTPCNKTYYGDIGKTYEVEIHKPKEDKLPFLCYLIFSAGNGNLGDIIQVTFDSFTLGTFTSFLKNGCPNGYLQILEAERPHVGGKWCGTSWGPTLYFSETKKITIVLYLWKLSSDQSGYNFDVRISYKMLKKNAAVVRFGGVTPGTPYDLARDANISILYHLPSPTPSALYYLGDLISGTYCSRIYSDCREKVCRLQSPNFPGIYPRNLTCYYAIRQHQVPPGKHAVISVRQSKGQLVSIRSSSSLYGRTPQQQQQSEQHMRKLKVWAECDEIQDYVIVYDGYTTRDSPLLKFCGGREPVPEVTSSGPELLVEFTTSPYGTFLSPGPSQSFHGFELEVEVHFLEQDSVAYTKNKKCDFNLRGSGRGTLESPKHSLTPNTTCTYHLEGSDISKSLSTFRPPSGKNSLHHDMKIWHKQISLSPSRFKIWLSVLKFEVSPPTLSSEEPCGITLQIWDGNFQDANCLDILCEKDKARLISSKKYNVTLLAKYCNDHIPKTCDHELLSSSAQRPRPCTLTESFLSSGNVMTLQLKMREATALRRVSFKALYEFVDLHQDGEAFGKGPCSRKFISRTFGQQFSLLEKFQSPRNVFLFGRGGNTNLSCIYRFEGQEGEIVKINIQNLEIKSGHCRSIYHQDINKVLCHGNHSAALHIYEYPNIDTAIPRDCFCSNNDGIIPFAFTSVDHIVEVRFEIFNMNAMDDFKTFYFEGSYEFAKRTVCNRIQRLKGPSGLIHFNSPSTTQEEINCEYHPWIIEPGKGKYLYVTAKGVLLDKNTITYEDILSNASILEKNPTCHTRNRIILYTGGILHSIVCPQSSLKNGHLISEIFSNGWLLNESFDNEDSVLSIETNEDRETIIKSKSVIVEYLGKESGQYYVAWLELGRRKSILPPEGYVQKDCIHKCPELDACINSSLWCDGTVHCPSGYDESLGHCYVIFQLPPLYLAFGIIGMVSLTTMILVATLRKCIVRKRKRQNNLNQLPSQSSLYKDKEVIC